MKHLKKLVAAALATSLPLAALAQTTPAEPAKPAETAPATTPPPAPPPAAAAKPAEDVMKVTPYGFVLLNAFWDGDTFTTRDYPGQVAGANAGGAFLMSARQSRFGVRLSGKDTSFTGADLSGVVEFDFKAGHIPTVAANGTASAPASTTWYNGVMRLRLASGTASWKFGGGQTFAVLAGQDYGLVNPLFAESLAWVADPLFWQAGNLWRRAPQIRATYTGTFAGLGLTLAGAMISPADGVTGAPYSTDFGPGNRSRRPDLEGRVAVSYKASPTMNGTVGYAYSAGKRRFAVAANPVANADDVSVYSMGIDAEINVPFLTAKGEWYKNKGEDDAYNGIFSPGVAGTAGSRIAIKGDGYWAQGILKPLPVVWVTIGYGQGKADAGDLTATTAATALATSATRKKNTQLAGGILFNAGKWWRFGVEAIKTETTSLGNSFDTSAGPSRTNKDDAMQIAVSSQLKF